jgi:hypothetical protein
MSKPLYDTDFYAWTQAQAAALQAKDWPALDLDHLVEEIADLGSSIEHELESRLANLLLHFLKWRYQPERRGKSWRNSIMVARQRIARRLRRSPSLRPQLPAYLVDAYTDAKKLAALQTDLPLATFPEACPWALDQVLDEDFFP